METGGQEGELSHSSLPVTGRIVNYRPQQDCQQERIINYGPQEERRYIRFLQETGSPATQLRGSPRLSELLSPMDFKVESTFFVPGGVRLHRLVSSCPDPLRESHPLFSQGHGGESLVASRLLLLKIQQ